MLEEREGPEDAPSYDSLARAMKIAREGDMFHSVGTMRAA